jgi:hypothetical protein
MAALIWQIFNIFSFWFLHLIYVQISKILWNHTFGNLRLLKNIELATVLSFVETPSWISKNVVLQNFIVSNQMQNQNEKILKTGQIFMIKLFLEQPSWILDTIWSFSKFLIFIFLIWVWLLYVSEHNVNGFPVESSDLIYPI